MHEEKEQRMRPWVLIALTIVLLGAGFLIRYGKAIRLFPPEKHMASEFGIQEYQSPNDTDADGIDDQTDILESARAYVASNPQYKSTYYDGGRPNDGYGVCTDVVDQALLGAGFDLMQLLDEDVRNHPEAYDIEKVDSNIDFRRVRNLRVFFPRHATELTLDTSQLDQWQGGDIVCWPNHIGIVSNYRNAQGVPLVIHNGSPFQLRYEEDVLTTDTWGDIVGHWRMG